ncbi:MAG TPA: OmpA family protein [Bacteroidales bacterium]|nr:OmpA family protein [Bacteroidales bacterium]
MKKLSFLLLLISIFPATLLRAQKDDARLDFYDGEFFLSEESYVDALLSFKKVYDAGYQDDANLNYRIGVCYLNIQGQKEKAIPYLEKACTKVSESYREGSFKEEAAAPDAFLFLGNAYRIDNQLDKAIETYREFLNRFNKGYDKENVYAKYQIEACQRAKEAIKMPVALQSENMGNIINSGLNNFHAVQSANDSVMAYMTARKFYDAVYFIKKNKNGWTNPVNITPQIQSDGDQYVTSLSSDGKQIFLVKITNFDSDIMVSEYDQRTWSKSKNIGKPINSKFFESHACISPDGNKLYFTSNRTGGFGEMDIYVSEKEASGAWGEPVNLGETINTPLNEDSPFLTSDGRKLYFSSQGHQTIGGYDIFYSTLNDDGTWSQPVAEPYPLNTTDDDIFFFPLNNGNQGYITRFLADGFGNEDIYKVDILPVSETAGINKTEKDEVKDLTAVEKANQIADVESNMQEDMNTEPSVEEAADKNEIAEVEAEEPSVTFYIKPIFFAFDSYALSDNARGKLGDIKDVLDKYQDLKLEVRGHTDAIGSEEYNQKLSERRAIAVIDYLAKLGVASNRMDYKGFSEDKPVALNKFPNGRDSKAGRQLNRRVEFHVIGTREGNIVVEPVKVPEDLQLK